MGRLTHRGGATRFSVPHVQTKKHTRSLSKASGLPAATATGRVNTTVSVRGLSVSRRRLSGVTRSLFPEHHEIARVRPYSSAESNPPSTPPEHTVSPQLYEILQWRHHRLWEVSGVHARTGCASNTHTGRVVVSVRSTRFHAQCASTKREAKPKTVADQGRKPRRNRALTLSSSTNRTHITPMSPTVHIAI